MACLVAQRLREWSSSADPAGHGFTEVLRYFGPIPGDTQSLVQPLVILEAPSNLGLRPPMDGSVPGCYKLGWALREAGFSEGIDIVEAGVLVPPCYEAAWAPGAGDRNAAGIATYSVKLADRWVESLHPGSGLRILDLGCGNGYVGPDIPAPDA